jgi:hypothetical protein
MTLRSWWLVLAVGTLCCSSPGPVMAPDSGTPVPQQKPPPAAPSSVGAVTDFSGQVTLTRADADRPVQREPLLPFDALTSGVDGRATLRLGEGQEVVLSPGSHLTLTADGGTVTLNLDVGEATSRVQKATSQPGVGLFIETPLGLTRITEGEVLLKSAAEASEVRVSVGEVEQFERSGGRRTLKAGETVRGSRELEPVELSVVVGASDVRAKLPGEKAFRKLPKGTAAKTLPVGSKLQVASGLVFLKSEGGLEVGVRGGSQVGLIEAAPGSAGVQLEKGRIDLSAPAGAETTLDLGEGSKLKARGLGQATLVKTATGFTLAAQTGNWELAAPTGAPLVATGGTIAETGASPGTRTASMNSIQLATGKRIVVSHSGAVGSLTWPCAGPGAEVEVATDSSFQSPILRGPVGECFVNVPLPARGNLFWKATRAGVTEQGEARFQPEARARPELSLTNNEVTQEKELTVIYFQDKPPQVTFRCDVAPGAASYRIRVYPPASLNIVAETKATTPLLSLPAGSLAEGAYRWGCTPLDKGDAEVTGGQLRSLELVFDNTTTDLRIDAPRLGAKLAGETRVAGVAPKGSRLFVNGKPLPLSNGNRFEGSVPLNGGSLIFRLVQGETERYVVRGTPRQ